MKFCSKTTNQKRNLILLIINFQLNQNIFLSIKCIRSKYRKKGKLKMPKNSRKYKTSCEQSFNLTRLNAIAS